MNSNIKNVDRRSLAFSTAMLLACVWAGSTAYAGEELRSQTVKFQDLNVNTPEGVRALYSRIHAAAWQVCSSTTGDPIEQMGARACARKAEAKAIETVNLPQLTAFYRTKTGDRTQPLSASR
jgi:UrcA family protein